MDGFLSTANSKKLLSLGISIPQSSSPRISKLLRGMTPGWVQWHIFGDEQLQELITLHQKWLPKNTANTPETMFAAVMRALLSRHIKPHPCDIGVDMEGTPVEPQFGSDDDD